MKKKMFKFHKIGNEVASGWYALIDSEEALLAHLRYMGKRTFKNWQLIKDSPENKDGHCKTSEAGSHKTLLTMEMVRRGVEQMSMVDSISYLSDLCTKAVIKVFSKEGAVYVSRNGAVRPSMKILDFESILEERESEDYVFPVLSKTDLKIQKWPRGKHFYIMENGKSVEIEGKVKWNTIRAAQEARDKYWGSIENKNFTQVWHQEVYEND